MSNAWALGTAGAGALVAGVVMLLVSASEWLVDPLGPGLVGAGVVVLIGVAVKSQPKLDGE